jgi:hypothetical protein
MMRVMGRSLIVSLAATVAACNGTNGTSGSGGGGGASEYAGTYQGSMLITATDGNQTFSLTVPMMIQVSDTGQIAGLVPQLQPTTQCTGVAVPQLQGNSFSSSGTTSCTDPNLGTCNVPYAYSGNIVGGSLSSNFSATYSCTAGTYTANGTLTANRTG